MGVVPNGSSGVDWDSLDWDRGNCLFLVEPLLLDHHYNYLGFSPHSSHL